MPINLVATFKPTTKLLIFTFLVLFLLRLYRLDGPIVDHHSWNQVSAAAMAKYIAVDWQALFYPTVDLLNSLADPDSVYAQEFPLYHIPVALIYLFTGVQNWPGRLVSILFGLWGLWYWYLLVARYSGERIAFITLCIAGISPLNWYFQRTVMSDNAMVTAMLGGFYYFCLWTEEKKTRYYWASLLWTLACGLFKAYGMIIGLAYLLYLLFRKQYWVLKKPSLYFYLLAVWLPLLAWIMHASALEEGKSEFSNLNQILHPELLWDADFYSNLILARFTDQILTPLVALFAVLGLWNLGAKPTQKFPLMCYFYAVLVYVLMVQRGNYVHDYYQLMVVPPLAWLAAEGVEHFIQNVHWREDLKKAALLVTCVFFITQSTIYAFLHTRPSMGSYATGVAIANLSQNPHELVLVYDVGSSKRNQLLYYTERKGYYTEVLEPSIIPLYQKAGVRWLGISMTQEKFQRDFQTTFDQLRQLYPLKWEDRLAHDHLNRPTVNFVFDLTSK